jgi:hypothetical protein
MVQKEEKGNFREHSLEELFFCAPRILKEGTIEMGEESKEKLLLQLVFF